MPKDVGWRRSHDLLPHHSCVAIGPGDSCTHGPDLLLDASFGDSAYPDYRSRTAEEDHGTGTQARLRPVGQGQETKVHIQATEA